MTNNEVLNLLVGNIILIVLVLVSIIKIIPPEWAGFWKYMNNKKEEGLAPKITILNFVLSNFVDSVVRAVFIPLLSSFGLKNMVTLIIFLVVIFEVFYRREISGAGVTLISVGILALYLDKLIETGKHLKLFGGLLVWNKQERQDGRSTESLSDEKIVSTPTESIEKSK